MSEHADHDGEMSPFIRLMVSIFVMTATVMQVLDTTVANVALPYMQGSLSTTQDQINWVLTSYLIAAAIMTSPVGWMAARFGRKRLYVVCTAGFTIASMLCGISQNIEQMVLFRLAQGMFGAALVPLAQAVMLDAYPLSQRAAAMAVWGMGIMLGPILGPTLGGWLTDNYTWRWVFYVNVPFGALTVLGLSVFMPESRIRRDLPFAWFGFLSLSIGVGALQMMLDRGQDLGWFDSDEIWIEAILAVAGFYFFLADTFTSKRPFIAMRIFLDRNFSLALGLMFLNGLVLLATMALMTPMLQNLLGYPVLTSGYLLGARGVGTFVAMMFVGRMLGTRDARPFMLFGLTLATLAQWVMVGWNDDVSARAIALNGMLQGFGLGFVFTPLNTVAFATLPRELRAEATGLWTLVRNIGASVGISILIARLVSRTTVFHSQLVEHVTPFNDAMRLPNAAALAGHSLRNLALLDGVVTQQAAVIAYSNDFLLMTIISLVAFPLVLMMRAPKAAPRRRRRAPTRPRRSIEPGAPRALRNARMWKLACAGRCAWLAPTGQARRARQPPSMQARPAAFRRCAAQAATS
jgi:DHA2 family multidrug resistance protein